METQKEWSWYENGSLPALDIEDQIPDAQDRVYFRYPSNLWTLDASKAYLRIMVEKRSDAQRYPWLSNTCRTQSLDAPEYVYSWYQSELQTLEGLKAYLLIRSGGLEASSIALERLWVRICATGISRMVLQYCETGSYIVLRAGYRLLAERVSSFRSFGHCLASHPRTLNFDQARFGA
ncbi:hypothetical protein K402DRAFT_106944 [Aulographum hederae CBS 113979]|uniref:Uncharacterized protein n=1 Tax=Aulographum hederae CBS 113979 TaxID=1176131 RepID=A0A6G1GX04_9PEZI|nr:hypothetical protein K402DRAFT_106944 [Aulographum hederae CBS 113979]